MTASSGEALTLCFRGLENTRTFGAPTAGYTSVNMLYNMYDGAQMYLTVAFDKARTGEIFKRHLSSRMSPPTPLLKRLLSG